MSAHREPLVHVDPATAWELITEDEARWQAWSAQIDDHLPCRDTAVRNWDYRYAWPRDASIGVAAFLRVGKLDEARGFLGWLSHASRLQRPRLPSLLTLDGRHVPP